jgi:hypothetical protein
MVDARGLRAACHGAILALLLVAIAVAAAAPARAAPPPRADGPTLEVPLHEAVYHATVRRIPVRAILRLEKQNDGLFLYRSWVEPRGPLSFIRKEVSETSLVLLDADGVIQPISYRRRDEFSGRNSDMLFQHANRKLNIDYRDEQNTIDWEPGIYDVLSLRLVLVRDLARGKLKDIYRVVDDRGRIENVDVKVVGKETLSTPLGKLATIRLEYTNHRRERSYRLWIAEDMDSAMIRLEQYENGKLRGSLGIVEYRRL